MTPKCINIIDTGAGYSIEIPGQGGAWLAETPEQRGADLRDAAECGAWGWDSWVADPDMPDMIPGEMTSRGKLIGWWTPEQGLASVGHSHERLAEILGDTNWVLAELAR